MTPEDTFERLRGGHSTIHPTNELVGVFEKWIEHRISDSDFSEAIQRQYGSAGDFITEWEEFSEGWIQTVEILPKGKHEGYERDDSWYKRILRTEATEEE